DEISQLLSKTNQRKISKYKYVYSPATTPENVYFLVSGMVKVYSLSDQKKEAIKAFLDTPDIFGEHAITGEFLPDEFAVSMQDDTVVLELKRNDFCEMMAHNHKVSEALIAFLGQKVKMMERRLESQIFKNARTRIIDFIKESACKRGKRIGYDLFLKRNLTQQEIANYTGTSRQTVTEVFNELKKSNQIFFNRDKILIRE